MGRMEGIFTAWGRILAGYAPNLSIEITKECPLRCPGCYAFGEDHLGGDKTLREVSDYKGDALVNEVLRLVHVHRALHLSIVGGEPLVRYRELNSLLPKLAAQGTYTQLVTSAVRPIPIEWAGLNRLQIVVSIDGLQPEHDERRKPATYDRILKHIQGHEITIHSTITRQQTQRAGYLEEFIRQWSENPNVSQMWFSMYTPQIGEEAPEILLPADRTRVVHELMELRQRFPKVAMPEGLLKAYLDPPKSPEACIFAQTTTCISADLESRVTPCQFGGNPDCAQCGCMASAALHAVGRHRLSGGIRVGAIYDASVKIGKQVKRWRPAGVPAPASGAAR
jgi:sulfatase maturation enzyme AslB (radical SAM superfamily)